MAAYNPKDELLLNLREFEGIFKLKGFIYGGTLRDLIAGIKPRDIDVRVYDFDRFIDKMVKLGAKIASREKKEAVLEYNGYILDVHSLDSLQKNPTMLMIPDYNINTLITDGKQVWSWLLEYADHVDETIDDIRNFRAHEMWPSNVRQEKMLGKVFKILPMRRDGWYDRMKEELEGEQSYLLEAEEGEIDEVTDKIVQITQLLQRTQLD